MRRNQGLAATTTGSYCKLVDFGAWSHDDKFIRTEEHLQIKDKQRAALNAFIDSYQLSLWRISNVARSTLDSLAVLLAEKLKND